MSQLLDTIQYSALTADPTPKQTRTIQKTLDGLMRDQILPAPTASTLAPKDTSIARAPGLQRSTKRATY